jgi:hypothetical protein
VNKDGEGLTILCEKKLCISTNQDEGEFGGKINR